MIKECGSFYFKLRKLRQALYKEMEITGDVREIFPQWKRKLNEVSWEDSILKGDSDLGDLLFNELMAVDRIFKEQAKMEVCTVEDLNHVFCMY